MSNEAQFLLAMAAFDYVGAIIQAALGKKGDAVFLAITGLFMSLIFAWKY